MLLLMVAELMTRVTDNFLNAFRKVQCLSSPSINEVDAYQNFLNSSVHIVPEETEFLSRTDDLLTLPSTDLDMLEMAAGGTGGDGGGRHLHRDGGSGALTPRLGDTARNGTLHPQLLPAHSPLEPSTRGRATANAASGTAAAADGEETDRRPGMPHELPAYLVYGMLVAVIVPVLTFPVFPRFAERLIIIALVFSGVGWAMWQAGIPEGRGRGEDNNRQGLDMILCAGAYVSMMAVAARICH